MPTTADKTLKIRNAHDLLLYRNHLRKIFIPEVEHVPSQESMTFYREAWLEYRLFTGDDPAKMLGSIDLWDEIAWHFERLGWDLARDVALARVRFLRYKNMYAKQRKLERKIASEDSK